MFKPGDKIQRINDNYESVVVGRIYTFAAYHSRDIILLEGHPGRYDAENFVLVKKHKKELNDIEWLDQIQLNFKE